MTLAMLLEKDDEEGFRAGVREIADADLPDGEVLIDVDHSTVNYKDALAITDSSPIVRSWPMVPGIDLAGTVSSSTSSDVAVGSKVVVNGWGLGETRWGGLAQRASVEASMLVPLPAALSTEQAMAIGTAGYTAMLCVLALEAHGVEPGAGPVLVTGAVGGVGSFAVALLAGAGFDVVAATGRPEQADYLRALGAASIVDRDDLAGPGKPLQRTTYAGAVDVAGSHTLANVCAQIQPFGAVAACGLAQGMDFPSSVAPFILRGVSLLGIDSVYQPKERRVAAWERLATDLPVTVFDQVAETIALDGVIDVSRRLLDGQVRGRVVVDVPEG